MRTELTRLKFIPGSAIPQGIMEHLWIKMRPLAHSGQQLESGPVSIENHSDRVLKAMLSSNSKATIIHQRLAMHHDPPALGLNAMLKPAKNNQPTIILCPHSCNLLLHATLKAHTQDPATFKLNPSSNPGTSFFPNGSTETNISNEKLPLAARASPVIICNSLAESHRF
jgi:hypothetical protein